MNLQDKTQWILRGYADFKERTPWERCPITEEEWHEDPFLFDQSIDVTEQWELYWEGWTAGTNDAFAAASRRVKHEALETA